MEKIYELGGLILLIIGLCAVTKLLILFRRDQRMGRRENMSRRNEAANTVGGNENPETGPMVYFANDRHGSRDNEYQFNYKRVGGSWRAYILKMPSLGYRDSSGSITHRLYDNGKPYVCWDSPVRSLKGMQTISKAWADGIQEYIATGQKFG